MASFATVRVVRGIKVVEGYFATFSAAVDYARALGVGHGVVDVTVKAALNDLPLIWEVAS